MVIAAVQAACNDIVNEFGERMYRGTMSEANAIFVTNELEDVVRKIQRRLTEKDANHAG